MDTYNDYQHDDFAEYDDYPDEPWSKSFCRFIRSCMEKNPANRPTCQQLLNDNHLSHYADDAYQENRRQRLKQEICDIVPDVGHSPKTLSMKIPEESERPEGTTWVFTSGSQVMAARAGAVTVDDALDELDELTKQLGGENYKRSDTQGPPSKLPALSTQEKVVAEENDDDDGLDGFLDEFEKTTAGENFSRDR